MEIFSGQLAVPQKNKTGCDAAAYGSVSTVKNWVALVEFGDCSFSAKEETALSLGAGGLIVYLNAKKENAVLKTTSGKFNVNIEL